MSVRINGLDTHYMYRDVVDILEQAGDNLDTILIPKVGTDADVYANVLFYFLAVPKSLNIILISFINYSLSKS